MSSRTSRAAAAIRAVFCAGFVMHFGLVALQLSPMNPAVGVAGDWARAYHNGATYQNWHLFSPDPGISTTFLSVRCWTPNGSSEWFDPLSTIEPFADAEHRWSDMRRTLQLRRSLPMRAWSEAEKLDKKCPPDGAEGRDACIEEARAEFPQTPPMRAARRAASAACLEVTHGTAFAYDLELIKTMPKPYSQRDDARPFAAVQRLAFDEVFHVDAPR